MAFYHPPQVTSTIFGRLVGKGSSLTSKSSWLPWPTPSADGALSSVSSDGSVVVASSASKAPADDAAVEPALQGFGLNTLFLRLVLQSLASPWVVPLVSRSTVAPVALAPASSSLSTPFAASSDVILYSPAAQPVSELLSDFDAAVHSSLPPELPAARGKPGSQSSSKRAASMFVSASADVRDMSPHPARESETLSWEWKEGRLMCFELILEKLLANHDRVISSVERSTLSPIGRYKDTRRRGYSPSSNLSISSSPSSAAMALQSPDSTRNHRRSASLSAISTPSAPLSQRSGSGSTRSVTFSPKVSTSSPRFSFDNVTAGSSARLESALADSRVQPLDSSVSPMNAAADSNARTSVGGTHRCARHQASASGSGSGSGWHGGRLMSSVSEDDFQINPALNHSASDLDSAHLPLPLPLSAMSTRLQAPASNLSILEEISSIDPRNMARSRLSAAGIDSPRSSLLTPAPDAVLLPPPHRSVLASPSPRANLSRHLSTPVEPRNHASSHAQPQTHAASAANSTDDAAVQSYRAPSEFVIGSPLCPDPSFCEWVGMACGVQVRGVASAGIEANPETAAASSAGDAASTLLCPYCTLEHQTSRLNLVSFSALLHHMLLQTTAASLEPRWELRRMADQVLPLLVQVFSWFDMRRLEALWLAYLPTAHEFLHCVACLSLKYALRTVLELRRQLDAEARDPAAGSATSASTPTASGSSSASGKVAQMQHIIRRVSGAIPSLLPHLLHLSRTSPTDKIRTLCCEIFIMIQAHFAAQVAPLDRLELLNAVDARLTHIRRMMAVSVRSFASSLPVAAAGGGLQSHAHVVAADLLGPAGYAASSSAAPRVSLLDRLTAAFAPSEPNAASLTFATSASLAAALGAVSLASSAAAASSPAPTTVANVAPLSPTAVSRSKRAERVQQWLLSCVHHCLPHLVENLSMSDERDENSEVGDETHAASAMVMLPHLFDFLRAYHDRDTRSSVIRAIGSFWTNVGAHVGVSASAGVSVHKQEWNDALELSARYTVLACAHVLLPAVVPASSTSTVSASSVASAAAGPSVVAPVDSGHIKEILHLLGSVFAASSACASASALARDGTTINTDGKGDTEPVVALLIAIARRTVDAAPGQSVAFFAPQPQSQSPLKPNGFGGGGGGGGGARRRGLSAATARGVGLASPKTSALAPPSDPTSHAHSQADTVSLALAPAHTQAPRIHARATSMCNPRPASAPALVSPIKGGAAAAAFANGSVPPPPVEVGHESLSASAHADAAEDDDDDDEARASFGSARQSLDLQLSVEDASVADDNGDVNGDGDGDGNAASAVSGDSKAAALEFDGEGEGDNDSDVSEWCVQPLVWCGCAYVL